MNEHKDPVLVNGECLPTLELDIEIFLPYVGGVHMSMIGMLWIEHYWGEILPRGGVIIMC